MNYIVSGHGGRYASPEHRIVIPNGFTVVFFTQDNTGHDSVTLGWPLFNHLLVNDERYALSQWNHTFFSGAWIYNYSCWYYPEITSGNGIFRVGAYTTSNPLIDISGYIGTNPLTLSQIFTMLEPGVIYWLACRWAS
jgi:hypothetical protein